MCDNSKDKKIFDYNKHIPCIRTYYLYPTDEQKDFFDKNFNACKAIYNLALETKMAEYDVNMSLSKNKRQWTSTTDLINYLPLLKKDNDWLKEPMSEPLQQSLRHLDTAFDRFFKKLSKYPKFKGKYNFKKAISLPHIKTISIDWDTQTIILPKIGEVKFNPTKNIDRNIVDYDRIQSTHITLTPSGKYKMTIKFIEKKIRSKQEKPSIKEENTIGIDVGLIDYIVTDSGESIPTPKYFQEYEEKLAVEQRKLAKKKHGSNNYKKQSIKVNRIHEKIKNKRLYFIHKLAYLLVVKNNQIDTICIENLSIKNMMKNKRLSKSIGNAGWATFFEILKYKADWYGVNILEANKRFASSKTCSNCDKINKDLKLSDRTFKCSDCGLEIPRDMNASINLIKHCLKKYNIVRTNIVRSGGGVHHLHLEGIGVTLNGHIPSVCKTRRENRCQNTPSKVGGEVSCLVETEMYAKEISE